MPFKLIAVLLLSLPLFAAQAPTQGDPDAQLYQQTLDDLKNGGFEHAHNRLEILPQFGVVTPVQASLRMGSYTIDHLNAFSFAPSFRGLLDVPLQRMGRFRFSSETALGYSYLESLDSKVTPSVGSFHTSLHWISLSTGLQTRVQFKSVPFIEPSLSVSMGFETLMQHASDARLDGNFYLLYSSITPALTFFKSDDANAVFGGLRLGWTYESTIDPAQRLTVMLWNLSVRFLL